MALRCSGNEQHGVFGDQSKFHNEPEIHHRQFLYQYG